MSHKHTVYDADPHFSIDPVTRSIENKSGKVVIMQYDHNSECLTFDIPRTIDGHDMSKCDLVEVHYDNVGSSKESYSGVEQVTDFHINPANQDQTVFSWLISGNATNYAGDLSFSISFQCTDNGVVDYEWGTDVYDGLTIRSRKRNSDKVVERSSDILATWKNELFGIGDTEESRMLAVSREQQEAISARGEAVLSIIPDDYQTLDEVVDVNSRTKANAIVCESAGETIVVNDSSNDLIRGLKVFGKSTQDGTPTPDNPVEIVSIITPTVGVYCRNLCRESALDDMGMNGSSSTYDSATRTITMTADPTGFAGCYCAPFKSMVVGKEYTVSFSIRGTPGKIVKCGWDKQGIAITLTDTFARYSVSLTATKKNEPIVFYSRPAVNGGLLSGEYMQFVDVQIEVGSVAHEYEPYAESQSFTLAHTLPGIPVTSGGNYTDSDGQQWICDEIDLERGVYVQRTVLLELTGKETWSLNSQASTEGINAYHIMTNDRLSHGHGYCTHFINGGSWANGLAYTNYAFWVANESVVAFKTNGVQPLDEFKTMIRDAYDIGNPVTLCCIRKTPIETPLTAEEITAFKALRTNYPNTTILNDAGAHMSVKYNADTKLYVDNKISAAISAFLAEHQIG